MEPRRYQVYIIGSLSGTLYVGITGRLSTRMWQHKQHVFRGFTAKYNVERLLYYETFSFPEEAIQREKQLKGWRRQKKIDLITKKNPQWVDLSAGCSITYRLSSRIEIPGRGSGPSTRRCAPRSG